MTAAPMERLAACCLAVTAILARSWAQEAGPEARSLPPSFLRYPEYAQPPRPPPPSAASSASSSAASASASSGFSGSRAFSKSEAFISSAGGGHAFSNSYAFGPEGERVAFSESGTGSSSRAEQASSSSAFSNAVTGSDGRRYGESGGQALSRAGSEAASHAYTNSNTAGSSDASSSAFQRTEDAKKTYSNSVNSDRQRFTETQRLSSSGASQSFSDERLKDIAQLQEIPVLQSVVPIVEEAILLTTPVPVLEEINLVPININNQLGPPRVPYQEKRKPPAPTRPYGAFGGEQTSIGNFQNERHGEQYGSTMTKHDEKNTRFSSSSQQRYGSSSVEEEENSRFSSASHQREPVVMIGYQQPNSYPRPQTSSEASDTLRSILNAMQNLLKSSAQAQAHAQVQRPNQQRFGDAPEEILYQSQVSNVNKDSSHRGGSTHVDNIISQISGQAETTKRPSFVEKDHRGKFPEGHASTFRPDHAHPHHEAPQFEDILRTPLPQPTHSTPFGVPPFREADSTTESVAYAATERQPVGHKPETPEKFLMFNGRRYTSEELAQAFNATRPSPKPAQIPKPSRPPSYSGHPNHHSTPSPPSKTFSSPAKLDFPHFPPFAPPPFPFFGAPPFSRLFFDRPPHNPFPSPTSHVAAASAGVTHTYQPLDLPTNYFIYPGTIRDGKFPPYVREHRSKDLSATQPQTSKTSPSKSGPDQRE